MDKTREAAIMAAAIAYSHDDYLAGALGMAFDAGAASVDRVEVVREAFENLGKELRINAWSLTINKAMKKVLAAMEKGKC